MPPVESSSSVSNGGVNVKYFTRRKRIRKMKKLDDGKQKEETVGIRRRAIQRTIMKRKNEEEI
jgi:hypothetical protein